MSYESGLSILLKEESTKQQCMSRLLFWENLQSSSYDSPYSHIATILTALLTCVQVFPHQAVMRYQVAILQLNSDTIYL